MTTSRYTIYRNQDAGVNDETKARYKLNPNKKVFVYKNLHKDCWSVKQNGLVKMHTTQLVMVACKFKVNEKGRQRVLEEQRKNVHAGIHGLIMTTQRSGNPPNKKNSFFNEQISYNPYKNEKFIKLEDGSEVRSAFFVSLDIQDGVRANQTEGY